MQLATILTGRLPQIRAAHTINGALRHSVLITLPLSAAIPRRSSAVTLHRRGLTPLRAARTRHLAADRLEEEDILPVAVAVAEVEVVQDRTAAKQQLRIPVQLQNKKARCFERAFLFVNLLGIFLEVRSLEFQW